ncbi:MAG TPA: hypothetical protein VIV64_05635 [Gammaproteobacteria bacterium]
MKQLAGPMTSIAALALTCLLTGVSSAQEANGEEGAATDGALDDLVAAYEALAGMLGQGSEEAVDRVQSDIENLGDWEYRIVELPNESTEVMADELNALGDERWEVFWIEPAPVGLRVYLKRPSVSYLSRVPLTTLLRLLAIGA